VTDRSDLEVERSQTYREKVNSWLETASGYTERPAIVMAFLGFSAGLPLFLVFGTLSFWLAEEGVSKTSIGLFSWVGLAYAWKFLWSPLVDRVPLYRITGWLGRRRSWMIIAQIGIAVGLVGMAFTDPATDLWQMAIFAVAVAFFSATQDIALDAYRIESAPIEKQGILAATYQGGYGLARLMASAGTLYIAEYFNWSATYLAMACLMAVGFFTVLVSPEGEASTVNSHKERAKTVGTNSGTIFERFLGFLKQTVVEPLMDFFKRFGHLAPLILLFILVYKLSDITLGTWQIPSTLTLDSLRQMSLVLQKHLEPS